MRNVDSTVLERATRASHRAVLTLVAACALVSALWDGVDPEPAPDPFFTSLAVGLAVGTVLLRRAGTSPAVSDQTSSMFVICSHALAAGLGLLGAFIAIAHGARQTGIVFALAGGLFCLRRPTPIGARKKTPSNGES